MPFRGPYSARGKCPCGACMTYKVWSTSGGPGMGVYSLRQVARANAERKAPERCERWQRQRRASERPALPVGQGIGGHRMAATAPPAHALVTALSAA